MPRRGRYGQLTVGFVAPWSAPPELRDALRGAFADWGAVSGIEGHEVEDAPILRVVFGIVDGGNTTAIIGCGYGTDGYLAGCTMTVDAAVWAAGTPEDHRILMRHEVGHAIGLGHGQSCGVMSYVCHTPNITEDDAEGARWLVTRGPLVYRQSVTIARD